MFLKFSFVIYTLKLLNFNSFEIILREYKKKRCVSSRTKSPKHYARPRTNALGCLLPLEARGMFSPSVIFATRICAFSPDFPNFFSSNTACSRAVSPASLTARASSSFALEYKGQPVHLSLFLCVQCGFWQKCLYLTSLGIYFLQTKHEYAQHSLHVILLQPSVLKNLTFLHPGHVRILASVIFSSIRCLIDTSFFSSASSHLNGI